MIPTNVIKPSCTAMDMAQRFSGDGYQISGCIFYFFSKPTNQKRLKDRAMGAPLFSPPDIEQKLANIIENLSDNEKAALQKILDTTVSGEKRTGTRKRFLIPASITCQNKSFYSRIENLSEQGAYIKTDHLIPPGNEIFLTFSILNFEFPVELCAEVIRISKHGIAIRFKPSSALSYRLAIEKLSDAINPRPTKV